MKKALFIISLILSWLLLIIITASFAIFSGIIPTLHNWWYTLGTVAAIPSLWLLCGGIAMLLRPIIYKAFFGQKKIFHNTTAIVLIVIGVLGITFSIGSKLVLLSSTRHDTTTFKKAEERSNYEDVIKKIEKQYIALCKNINSQLPIRVDEMTILHSVTFYNWIFTYNYYAEIDKKDFTKSEIELMMEEMRKIQKQQVSEMIAEGDYNLTHEDFRYFCKETGLKFRFSYYDINKIMIGTNVFDYSDF